MNTKICSKCRVEKPAECYAKDASRKSGLQPRCKECQKQLATPWREKNHELLLEKGAEYRAANPEKRKASVLAWDSKNRERNRARQKAYYKLNPHKQRERYKKRQAKVPEGYDTNRVRAWRRSNLDVAREAIRRYRTRKKNAYIEHVDFAVLYERNKGICQICFQPVERDKATLDHIIPLSKGGLHCMANVQIAHGRCNSSKGCKISTPA